MWACSASWRIGLFVAIFFGFGASRASASFSHQKRIFTTITHVGLGAKHSFLIFYLFIFFFLEKKETKIQGNSPIPIFLRACLPRKRSEKMVIRTELPKPAAPLPTYEKGANLFLIFLDCTPQMLL